MFLTEEYKNKKRSLFRNSFFMCGLWVNTEELLKRIILELIKDANNDPDFDISLNYEKGRYFLVYLQKYVILRITITYYDPIY